MQVTCLDAHLYLQRHTFPNRAALPEYTNADCGYHGRVRVLDLREWKGSMNGVH